ncbi:MAG: hypothetical protein V7709_08295 [Halioglobus sp.]
MPSLFRSLPILLSLTGVAVLGGCGEKPELSAGSDTMPANEQTPQAAPEPTAPGIATVSEPEASDAEAPEEPADADAQTIDSDELEPAGEIELKQYTVAWVGSGTMGGGTLTVDGKEYPFRLAGLGIGGYGASSIDALGTVYNLPNLDAFPGTYGNARLGMTGGDSGGGKLWLRNPDGVVIELKSEMRGLALAGGVDGILIQWDDEEDSQVDQALDDTRDAAGGAIEAGADGVQQGVDSVKGWFKKKG